MCERSMRDRHSFTMKSPSKTRNCIASIESLSQNRSGIVNKGSFSKTRTGIFSKKSLSKSRNDIVCMLLLLLPGLVDAQFRIRSPIRSIPSPTLRLSRPRILSTGSGNLQTFSDLSFQQSRGSVRTIGRTSGFDTVQRGIQPIGASRRLIVLPSSVQRNPSPPARARLVQRPRKENPAISRVIPASSRSGTRDVFPATAGTQSVRRTGTIISSGSASVPLVSDAGIVGVQLHTTGNEIQVLNSVVGLQPHNPKSGLLTQTIPVGQQQHTAGAGTLPHASEAGLQTQAQAITVGTKPRVNDVGTQPIVGQTSIQSAVITTGTQPIGSPQPDAFHQELVDVFTNVIEGILAPQSAVAQPTNQNIVQIGPSASIHQSAFQPFYPASPYNPYAQMAHFRSMNPWELPAMMQEMWYGDTQDPPDGVTTTAAPAKISATVKPLIPLVTSGPALTVDTVVKSVVGVKPSNPIDTIAPVDAVVKAGVGVESPSPIDTKVPINAIAKAVVGVEPPSSTDTKSSVSAVVKAVVGVKSSKPIDTKAPVGAVVEAAVSVKPSTAIDTKSQADGVVKVSSAVQNAVLIGKTKPVVGAIDIVKEVVAVKETAPSVTTGPVLLADTVMKGAVDTKHLTPIDTKGPVLGVGLEVKAVKPVTPSDTKGSVLAADAVVDVSSLKKDAAPSNMAVTVIGADHITDHITN